MVSHGGYKVKLPDSGEEILFDKIVAENISDIDVIIGGHSHDLIKGLTSGYNVFNSPKGEPVVIVQAGRDGLYHGILNTVFNENGVIDLARTTNTIKEVLSKTKSDIIQKLRDKYLGKKSTIAELKSSLRTGLNPRAYENKAASLVADAMRYATGAQIAFINSGNIRGNLLKGSLDANDIADITPFDLDHYKVNLSEKDIVDVLNVVAKSFKNCDDIPRPGLLQCSGLQYTIKNNGLLKEVYIKNDDGSLIEINIENPSKDKFYTATYNSFLLKGAFGFDSLKKDPENPNEVVEVFKGLYKSKMLEKYLEENFKNKTVPVPEDRITVEQVKEVDYIKSKS